MDSTYYKNNLKFLYQSDDTNVPAVYNVDNLLFNYTDQATFTGSVIPSSFFNNITDLQLYKEDPGDVQSRINTVDNVNLSKIPTTTTFTEVATQNEVRVELVRGGQISTDTILKGIAQEIEYVTSKESALLGLNGDITKSHTAFDQYMIGILSAVCSPCFIQAIKRLPANFPPNTPNNLQDAMNDVGLRTSSQINQIFTLVSIQVQKNLQEIILPLTNVRIDVMNDFNNTNGSFSRPMYYQLRNKISNELTIQPPVLIGYETEDYTKMYINKILTDVFIKTCYPLLHYLFIDAMMKKYAQVGDFINIRIALLAKIFYTFYFVDYINQNIYAPDSAAQSDSNKKAQYDSIFTQINTNLNNYLTSINNIDISTNPGKNAMADLINSLHNLSNNVVLKSQQINDIKTQIVENQSALRSIIANVDIERGKYAWKVFEFSLILIVLLIVVIGSGVLLFLNKSQYVFYVAGATLTIVIIIKLIQFVNSFITKN